MSPTAEADIAVRLSGVSKVFGRTAVLREVTLEVPRGKLYVIVGENGAGKSTLLRMMAGLVKPSTGELTRATSAAVGFMSHDSMLYEEFTARENLKYFSRLFTSEVSSGVDEVIRRVGLDPALERPVSTYSQGMRQRLSLARVLLHGPELLLLDEPFANLDRDGALAMVRLIAGLRDEGKTVVLVTHQPSLFRGVAERFITLKSGRVESVSAGIPAVQDEVVA